MVRIGSSNRRPRAGRLVVALTQLALGCATAGCAMGPVRQKVLEGQHSATRAWPQEPAPPCGTLAAACGAGADVGLTVADTMVVPLGAVAMAGAFGLYGPDPHFDEFPPGIIFPPLGLLYFGLGLVASPVSAWMLSHGSDFRSSQSPDGGRGTVSSAATPVPTPTEVPGPLPDRMLRE